MKFFKKSKILTVSFILCILIAVLTGVIGLFNMQITAAFADTANNDLKFVLNTDKKSYKVSAANRKLTEAVIPEEYNGFPVTEIATNGFSTCINLEYAFIPNSVTKLGANAFMNCNKLQNVDGMAYVTDIGNNAFALCTSVKDLTISPRVKNLGSSIIRNVSNDVYVRNTEENIMSLNADWNLNSDANILYGNDLKCTEMYDDNNTLIGFSVNGWQLLDFEGYSIELSSYQYIDGKDYPILEISEAAFSGSSFDSLSIKYDENVGSDYTVKIGSSAFSSASNCGRVDIEVDIDLKNYQKVEGAEDELDYNHSIFAFSPIQSVLLPYSLNVIPDNMFQGCIELTEIKSTNTNLKTNQLSENINYIGEYAFDECIALSNIIIPKSVNYIGEYAFNNWGSGETQQTIKFDMYGPKDSWNPYWCSDIASNTNILYNATIVILNYEGGVGEPSYIEVQYGQAMPQISKPMKEKCEFMGFYTEVKGGGTQYYDSNMNSVTNWDRSEPTNLYAYWMSFTKIPVTLNPSYDGGNKVEVQVTLDQDMPEAIKPERIGYSFQGYYQYPYGYGTQYYTSTMESGHVWDQDIDKAEIYAYWQANKYTVYLYNEEPIEVTYGEPMPKAEVPVRSNFIFQGYFSEEDGDGTQYYSEDMQSLHNWDIASDNVTLYPKWIGQYYDVYFIPTKGSSDLKFVTVEYSKNFPSLSSKDAPKAVGYTFKGYYTDWHGGGEYIYDSNMQSTEFKYFDTSIKVLYGDWEPIIYTINLISNGGSGGTDVIRMPNMSDTVYSATEDVLIEVIAPVREHYTFLGYFDENESNNLPYFSEIKDESTRVIKCIRAWNLYQSNLVAHWQVTEYTIEYESYPPVYPQPKKTINIEEVMAADGNKYIINEVLVLGGIKATWQVVIDINNIGNIKITPEFTEATIQECYDNSTQTYIIGYASQLNDMRELAQETINGIGILGNFELANDIDLSILGSNWEPLPTFFGSFDGKYHTINGLRINASSAGYYGLFSINIGYIRAITVVGDIAINGVGHVDAGMICGYNQGEIGSCVSSSLSTYGIVCTNPDSCIGGIVGKNNGTILVAKNIAGLSGYGCIGGIVGENIGGRVGDSINLIDIQNQGKILLICSNDSHLAVGGIVGIMKGGRVEVGTSSGPITVQATGSTGSYQPCVGTVVGIYYENNCYYGNQRVSCTITTNGTVDNTYIGGEKGRVI